LGTKPVYSTIGITLDSLLVSEFHKVVNHNSNDSGVVMKIINHCRISTVGYHRNAPFVNNKEVHPAEKTVKNDQARDDFKDEDNPLAFVDSIESLDHDTNRHVNDSNDDGSSHLDGVEESQGSRVEVPRRINSEGVNAIVTHVVARNRAIRSGTIVRTVHVERRICCFTIWNRGSGSPDPDEFVRLASLSLVFSRPLVSRKQLCWSSGKNRLNRVIDEVIAVFCIVC
jgi:hypothetical protein